VNDKFLNGAKRVVETDNSQPTGLKLTGWVSKHYQLLLDLFTT